jgi:hypothetical protein
MDTNDAYFDQSSDTNGADWSGGAGADGMTLPDMPIMASVPAPGLLPAPVKIILVILAVIIGRDILKGTRT